jgi:hypothetical protein
MEISQPESIGWVDTGYPAGSFIDSYNAYVFAVWSQYHIKTAYATWNNHLVHVLQFAISIILEFIFFLLYCIFLPIQWVNTSVICFNIHIIL